MANAAQDEYDAMFADRGRTTTHPEDVNNSDIDLDSDSDRDTPNPAHQSTGLPGSSNANIRPGTANIPHKVQHSNTGPKGVIKDAQDYAEAQYRASSLLSLQPSSRPKSVPLGPTFSTKDSAHDSDEDDGFIKQWRRDRLQKLQRGDDTPSEERRAQTPAVTQVDGAGYLDAVDGSGSETVVVVFIYDEHSEVSDDVETCLNAVARQTAADRELSKRKARTRFVKLRYQEASMDPAGVPAIIAYRNGNKFAMLVPLMDEIPDDAELSETTLRIMLER